MDELIDFINFENWKIVLSGIVIFMASVIAIVKFFDFVLDRFGVETKSMRRIREQKEDIQKMHDQIKELEVERKLDVERSEKNDEEIKHSITELKATVTSLSEIVLETRENENKSRRAQFKDRIGQAYRIYHEKQEWRQMDKEAFDDLVRAYESVGGSNSFVHTICEPESQTWKLLD